MNTLSVPLTLRQIEAAGHLYSHLQQWRLSEAALDALAERLSGFSDEVVLLKVVAVNGLYGTNVLALSRMAAHIKEVIADTNVPVAGPELVERIAVLRNQNGGSTKRHHSFASKFAHFFIDPERFPIMDSYAVSMLKVHLGAEHCHQNAGTPYIAFLENLKTLRRLAGLEVTNRELDRYLWIAGAYRVYRKRYEAQRKPEISIELERLFTNQSEAIQAELNRLMPSPTAVRVPRA